MKSSPAHLGLLALLTLLTACASAPQGVSRQQPGESQPAPVTRNEDLPRGQIDFKVAPLDVLQVDVYPRLVDDKQRRAEYANELRLEFSFKDKVYRVAPGDVLGVELSGESDKVYDVGVLPNGYIRLPRISREIPALGRSLTELTGELNKQYSVLLRNPQVVVSVKKSGLEELQRLSGNYNVDRDGRIVLPRLGSLKVLGMTAEQMAEQASRLAEEYFYNKIHVGASILSLTPRAYADPRLSPDGQQYFRSSVKVGPDGSVFVPDVGTIDAKDLTLSQLSTAIQNGYSRFYQNPVDVRVSLLESTNLSVFVGGEVRQPGKYPIHNAQTLMQLISSAGWVTDTADLSRVVLLHAVSDNGYVRYQTNLVEVADGKARLGQDLKLSPRDIVIIPKSGVASANLWVDQYIRRMLPFGTSVNYSFTNQVSDNTP